MEIDKSLEELRQERAQLDEAILSIERLALGQGKRRGRPPSWMALAKSKESISQTSGTTFWYQKQECRCQTFRVSYAAGKVLMECIIPQSRLS
jgi:hypothetical protein